MTLFGTPVSATRISQVLSKNAEKIAIFLGILAAFWVLIGAQKPEQLATLFISSIALVFSYQALGYSREKFRLDLFERRLEFYNSIVGLCSMVTAGFAESDDPDKREVIETVADECIRGLGYHKAHLLFGNDIRDKIKELNDAYITLSIQNNSRKASVNFDAAVEMKAFSMFQRTLNDLPKLFHHYIYFGDYKK